MTRSIRKCSSGGDTLLAEYDTDTVTPERLQEIEKEFNELMSKGGMVAFDVTDHKDEQIRGFKPDADIMFGPQIVGG